MSNANYAGGSNHARSMRWLKGRQAWGKRGSNERKKENKNTKGKTVKTLKEK